jgi:hypothetical protein
LISLAGARNHCEGSVHKIGLTTFLKGYIFIKPSPKNNGVIMAMEHDQRKIGPLKQNSPRIHLKTSVTKLPTLTHHSQLKSGETKETKNKNVADKI